MYIIKFEFDDSESIDFDYMYGSLAKLFGYAKRQSDSEYDWSYIWATKKTYLHFGPPPAEYDLDIVEISMRSEVLYNQILNDDF